MKHVRDVFAAAAHAVGYTSSSGAADFCEAAARVGLPDASRYVVVLIDGMGLNQLQVMRGHTPFLRRRALVEARTTFPSTTACAITSFATGRDPGRTGMIGYTARDPRTRSRIQLLSFAEAPVSPQEWQTEPTIAERADHKGTMCSVGPCKFAGTGLTLAAWRGIRPVFAESFSERIEATCRELARGARLVYLYWADLDHLGHGAGWRSEAWTGQLESVDAHLGELARRLPRDTGLVITADHGMVDIERRRDLADAPDAAAMWSAGEERLLQVFLENGVDVDAVAARTGHYLGDAGRIWSRPDMLARLGDVTPHVAQRVGDFAIEAQASWGISDSRWMSQNQMRLVGAHGAGSQDEMTVPLLVERT